MRLLGCFLQVRLGGGGQNGCCRLAEEPHQPLDILRSRCQEELLPDELESAQAQAAQPDLILQFGEQGFRLLSLPLCFGELCVLANLTCPLLSFM